MVKNINSCCLKWDDIFHSIDHENIKVNLDKVLKFKYNTFAKVDKK